MLTIRHCTLVWTISVAVAILALPVAVEAQEKSWQIRFDGLWIDPDLGLDRLEDGDRVVIQSAGQVGAGLALTRRFSRRLSFEIGAAFVEPDVTLRLELASGARIEAVDGLRFVPVTAGFNLHLTPDRKVDVYLGAVASYVSYGDLALDFAGTGLSATLQGGDDFGWGATFGFAVPVGEGPWSFHASALVLDTDVDLTDPSEGDTESLGFDPLIARVGLGFRF